MRCHWAGCGTPKFRAQLTTQSFSVDHITGAISVYASSLAPFSRKGSAHGLVTCVPASLVELVAAARQDYFAVPDFSIRYSILVRIFDHVTSQRFSDSRQLPL